MSTKFDYAEAKKSGYTDKEITQHLSKMHKSFDIKKAQKAGYTPVEINEYLSTYEPPEGNFGTELARGLVSGATPTLNTPAAKAQRKREFEASPEELIYLIDAGDVIPSYTDIPTSEESQQALETTFGEEGQGTGAKFGRRIGESLGGAMRLPGFTPGTAAALGTGAAAGQAVEEATESEGLGIGAELLTGGLVGSLSALGKKLTPSALVQAGEKIGLSPKLTTPLSASKGKKAFLGKFAEKGPKTEALLKETKSTLGNAMEDLSKKAETLSPLSPKQNKGLIDKLYDIQEKIQRNVAITKDQKDVIDFIDKGLVKLQTTGADPAELVNFYRTINSEVNWKNMSRGDVFRKEIKDAIKDTLRETNPEFSQEFDLLNDFYSRYFDLEKSLSQKEMTTLVKTLKGMKQGGQIIWSLTTGNPWPIVELIGEKAVSIYSRELLINPTLKKMNQAMLNMAKKGSEKGAQSVLRKEIDYLKNKYPGEFDSLDV